MLPTTQSMIDDIHVAAVLAVSQVMKGGKTGNMIAVLAIHKYLKALLRQISKENVTVFRNLKSLQL